MKTQLHCLIAVVSTVVVVQTACADVLLTDDFTVVSGDSTNLNEDISGGRQTGPLAPALYTSTQGAPEIGNTVTDVGQPDPTDGNYVLLENDASFYSNVKLNAVSSGPLTIEFDLYENGASDTDGDPTTWTAISLRSNGDSDGWPIVGSGEFGFIARANGGIHMWDGNGDSITPSGWDDAGFATGTHWKLIFSDTAGTGPAFSGNGSQVTFINGATTLGTITLSQQLNSSGLRLHFRNYAGRYAGIDNLAVSGTLIPQGAPLAQDIMPTSVETFMGDSVVYTAAFSNSSPVSIQWQQIVSDTNNSPIATNNINTGVVNETNNGVVSSTLTLNDVQVADSGSYRLLGINDNGTGYSTTSPLMVSLGSTNGNVVLEASGQSFDKTINPNYFPAWPVTTNSLVYGFYNGYGPGSPGTFYAVGDFTGGGNYCNADATVMSDGMAASMISLPNLAFVAGGPTINNVGSSITYYLANTGTYGIDLTNVTVFGGWQDGGRNEQKYQILYATVSAPTTFVPLVTADYNPVYSGNGQPSVTRTTLTPATGVLVHNVTAVKLSFDVSPSPKNGWEGYTEFIAQGTPSLGFAPPFVDIAPRTALDVVGSKIIISATFSNYTSLQWQKNGTNISGATASTLTLSNLSANDTATYVCIASSAGGNTPSSPCVVKVNPAPAPVGNILTSIAAQTSDSQTFQPTWDTSALVSSLIYGGFPSSIGPGDFSGGTFGSSPATACSDPSILTDGSFGDADFYVTTTHYGLTAMGTGTGPNNSFGGQSVTYTLYGSANGYTITNIMTSGGWNDGGRDEQAYTVMYSTLQNPDIFLPIATVDYNPLNPVGYSRTRATLTPVSGALATNVAALKFDMNYPRGENGYSGYSEFAVYGTPSANPPPAVPVITAQNEQGSFDYTVETPNLIANQLPSYTGPGVFTEEGCNETNLTDGTIGFGAAYGASCGADGTAIPWIIFSATNGTGWNLTNIVTYSLWNDYGRDGQFYNVSYATASAPATFVPLASVFYNPDVPEDGTASANRVEITPMAGQSLLAANVVAVKFDFTPQGIQDYGWSGYSEIVLQGDTVPVTVVIPVVPTINPPHFSGGNLILTGAGGTPNSSYSVLTATNLLTPLAGWTVYASGVTDGNGACSNSIPVNAAVNDQFYQLRTP